MFEVGSKNWYRWRWSISDPVADDIVAAGQFESRACHLCGAATDTPGCPLCRDCAEEQEEREQDTRLEIEQRRRPR